MFEIKDIEYYFEVLLGFIVPANVFFSIFKKIIFSRKTFPQKNHLLKYSSYTTINMVYKFCVSELYTKNIWFSA